MSVRRSKRIPFSLVALTFIVSLIGALGIAAAVAIPRMMRVSREANEAALKVNLHTMRSMIDQFYADHGRYPSGLTALVEEGYIRDLPIDPFTGSNGTWVEVAEEIDVDDEARAADVSVVGSPGIWDVASGAETAALDGESRYSQW